jgi:hypothetical protein
MIVRTLTKMNIQTHPPPLVVDKSFAQAVKAPCLSLLSRERTLLIPRAFHYEVFTTAHKKMFRTLVGLDDFRWVDKETLLSSEKDKGEPCSSAELAHFCVARKFLSPTWKPSSAENEMAERYKQESVDPFVELWEELMKYDPVGFSSSELVATGGTEAEFTSLCEKLRDPERIRIIAKEMNYCHEEKLDVAWFTFRFIQAFSLQSLVLRRRYPDSKARRSQKRIEHDLHDMEYLALGLHVRSLATADVSLKLNKASLGWRFKLLEPDYELLTT